MKTFTQDQLEAISGALGASADGLTNPEIEFFIRSASMVDPGRMTKRHRIFNAFVESQNSKRNRTHVLEFIRLAMSPARYSREPQRFEPMRAALNQALAFAGLVVDEAGALKSADVLTTLPEAQRRARELRADLEDRGVHPDVLVFCRAELLADDYFHAVQEAVKSVADKMRNKTGLWRDNLDQKARQSGSEPVITMLLLCSSRLSLASVMFGVDCRGATKCRCR